MKKDKKTGGRVKGTPNKTVGTIDNAEAAQTAMGRVIEVMGRGEITPSEASSVTSVIQNYLRAYELNELTEKVSDIEKALKKRKEAI